PSALLGPDACSQPSNGIVIGDVDGLAIEPLAPRNEWHRQRRPAITLQARTEHDLRVPRPCLEARTEDVAVPVEQQVEPCAGADLHHGEGLPRRLGDRGQTWEQRRATTDLVRLHDTHTCDLLDVGATGETPGPERGEGL